MATHSTLRNPWKLLLHPQHTQVLCLKTSARLLISLAISHRFGALLTRLLRGGVGIAMGVDV